MPALVIGKIPAETLNQNALTTLNEKEEFTKFLVCTPTQKYEHVIISSISTFFTSDHDYDPRRLKVILRTIDKDGLIFIPKSSSHQSIQRKALLTQFDKEGLWQTSSHLAGYDAFQNSPFGGTEFTSSLLYNTKEFIDHKITFYSAYTETIKEEYNLIQSRIERLKVMKYDLSSSNAIKDLFPTYSSTALFIVSLEELIDRLKAQKDALTLERIKVSLKEVNSILQSIIGHSQIKDKLTRIVLNFGRNWKSFSKQFNNFCIMGESGMGKTRISKIIGSVFEKIGLLSCGSVQVVSRADIVAPYVGQTAAKTRALLLDSLEGIVFVDEAYSLVEGGSRDYGTEAITEMINFMDKFVGMSVVIVSGYKGIMEKRFMKSNEGLSRRFPHRYVLQNYGVEELSEIVRRNVEEVSGSHPRLSDIIELVSDAFTKYKTPFKHHASDMVLISTYISEFIFEGDDVNSALKKGFDSFFKERFPKG